MIKVDDILDTKFYDSNSMFLRNQRLLLVADEALHTLGLNLFLTCHSE